MRNKLSNAICATLLMASFSTAAQSKDVLTFLRDVVSPETGIGAREAGTEQEQQTADYVKAQFTRMGLDVEVHDFKHPILKEKDKFLLSRNIIAEKKGKSEKVLVLGAHFDSTGSKRGSHGAMDNGAGLSVLLAVAEQLSKLDSLPYTVRFVAFGAEEIGKVGSRQYLTMLNDKPGEIERLKGMINLDTVAGGDKLYVHSAHTTPYKCGGDNSRYSSETWMRQAVLSASQKTLGMEQAHQIHPPFPGYPEGVTGEWSDHEPFACYGVPIAYIETTNFAINGKHGFDGYSQSTDPGLWDCFDKENVTACDREKEKKWGMIWHSGSDQLELLMGLFGDRVTDQLNANVKVLVSFFSEPDKFIKQ
ncbi:MAG: M28 family peptidase [Alteromonadaceae bacterium]|nr:M28 family peptidase [Alteromonadaceae bacterium]